MSKKVKSVKPSNPKRTLSECQQEYNALCAQLGQIYYQLSEGQKSADSILIRLAEINQEAQPLVEEERKHAQNQQSSPVRPAPAANPAVR